MLRQKALGIFGNISHYKYIYISRKNQRIHDNTLDTSNWQQKLAILHTAPDFCIRWWRKNAKVQGKYDLAVPGALQSHKTQNRNCWSVSQKGRPNKPFSFPIKICQPFRGAIGEFQILRHPHIEILMLCWGGYWWNRSTNAGWVWCWNKVAKTWHF